MEKLIQSTNHNAFKIRVPSGECSVLSPVSSLVVFHSIQYFHRLLFVGRTRINGKWQLSRIIYVGHHTFRLIDWSDANSTHNNHTAAHCTNIILYYMASNSPV